METTSKISFRDNMAGNFGHVNRSSAIFYYTYSPSIETTISFLNYWKYKRDLEVSVIASVREIGGRLLFRRHLDFKSGEVQNFRPKIEGRDRFEGSVEIEVFSIKNMVIPYAAVVASYKTAKGISIVHSYGRVYSNYEIEENYTIMKGEEACWTLRDTDELQSFSIAHNGQRVQPAQKVKLQVLNSSGATKKVEFDLPELAPFQTFKIIPSEKIEGLSQFLSGKEGFAKVSFELTAFTRMLVGNQAVDGTDLQVTHSNFNYSMQTTDHLENEADHGFMRVPDCGVKQRKMLVYPDADRGSYEVQLRGEKYGFSSEQAKIIPLNGNSEQVFEFKKVNGNLPTRIVSAIVLNDSEQRIPNECSLGVITPLQPPKRLWWGCCIASAELDSKLVVHDLPEIFGGMPTQEKFSIRLFSSTKMNFIERVYEQKDLALFSKGVSFKEIFEDADEFLGNDFGYYTNYSNYGGLTCYTLFENRHESVCLEHGF